MSRLETSGRPSGSKVMRRSASVFAFLRIFAVSSAVIRSSIVLPRDFDIFWPSVPSSSGTSERRASGRGNTGRSGVARP